MDWALLTVPHSLYHVSLHLDGMGSQRRSLAIYIIILQDDSRTKNLKTSGLVWFFFFDIRNLLNSRASVLLSNLKHRDVLDQ